VSDATAGLRDWLATNQAESEQLAQRPDLAGNRLGGADMWEGVGTGFGHVLDLLDEQQGGLDQTELRAWLETQQRNSDRMDRPEQRSGNGSWLVEGITMAYTFTLQHLDGKATDAGLADAAEQAQLFEGARRAHQSRVGASAGIVPATAKAAGAFGPPAPTTRRAAGSGRATPPGARPSTERSA
jgi:hypothetical protein